MAPAPPSSFHQLSLACAPLTRALLEPCDHEQGLSTKATGGGYPDGGGLALILIFVLFYFLIFQGTHDIFKTLHNPFLHRRIDIAHEPTLARLAALEEQLMQNERPPLPPGLALDGYDESDERLSHSVRAVTANPLEDDRDTESALESRSEHRVSGSDPLGSPLELVTNP